MYRKREEGTVGITTSKSGRKSAVKLKSLSINIGKCYIQTAGWKNSERGQRSLLRHGTDFQFIIIIIIITLIICLNFMELYDVYWIQRFWKASKEIRSIMFKLFFSMTLSGTVIYCSMWSYKPLWQKAPSWWNIFLGAFAKFLKANINFVMSVCPSVILSFCME